MTTNGSREHSTAHGDIRGCSDGRTLPERAAVSDACEPYASLMRYKRWADEDLFEKLLARPDIETEPNTAILREIVGHFHAVDRIFQAHLQGVPHAFTTTRLQHAPSLTQLKDEVVTVDQWYVDYAENVRRDTLVQERAIRFTDGSEKVFSRAEMLLHVAQHGTYHRGNAGVVLRMMGMELPPDRYLDYLETERRAPGA